MSDVLSYLGDNWKAWEQESSLSLVSWILGQQSLVFQVHRSHTGKCFEGINSLKKNLEINRNVLILYLDYEIFISL